MPSEAKTARSRRTRAALIAAVHDRLAQRGAFTAEEIAKEVGCTAATFWSHFGTKDDAVTAAFSTALEHLIELTERLFQEPKQLLSELDSTEREAWAASAIDELLAYFKKRSLIYRVALGKLQQSRALRRAYREAEQHTFEIVACALGPKRPTADAVAIVAFCQGLSNPLVLGSKRGDRTRQLLTRGLYALTFEG